MQHKTSTDALLDDIIHHYKGLHSNSEEEGTPIPAGVLLMHLYGFIVYPWETYLKQIRQHRALRRQTLNDWCTYRITNQPPEFARKPLPIYTALNIMRNAVSHAKVHIHDDQSISFQEKRGTTLYFQRDELKVFLDRWLEVLGVISKK